MTHTVTVTSHGADFFGQDTHSTKQIRSLAAIARGCLPYDDSKVLAQLLEAAGASSDLTIPAEQAGTLAGLLRTVAGHRFTKTKDSKLARLLGDSAARAAADGEPWIWTTSTAE
ncbi:hypothetical protein [Streptomyces sp. NPDC056227]|uniref:DUF7739 domain-containing protein n=1 Tax=Streptomyces sp. NPDC056227 TaxID=3345753 RepID=UPI0035DC1043